MNIGLLYFIDGVTYITLSFNLKLPSGREEKGFVRVLAAKSMDYKVGQEIILWFDVKEKTFFPEPAPKGFDPGVVGKEAR